MSELKTWTKQELESVYRQNTNDEAAAIFGVSVPTMLRILKNNQICLKGAGAHNNEPKLKVVN